MNRRKAQKVLMAVDFHRIDPVEIRGMERSFFLSEKWLLFLLFATGIFVIVDVKYSVVEKFVRISLYMLGELIFTVRDR